MSKPRITRVEAGELTGMCSRCKEFTSIAEPCCPYPAKIVIGGSAYAPEDFEITDNERKASV